MRKMEWKKTRELLKQDVRNMYVAMYTRGDEDTWDICWAVKKIAWRLSQETGFKQCRLKRIASEVLTVEWRELENLAFEQYF